jgi:hypothetical protein
VLAKDGSGWMAVDATSVERDGQEVFHASASASVEWESTSSGTNLTLHTPASAAVEIASATKPDSVELDGKAVAPIYMDGLLTLAALPAGEHHVEIR